MVLYLERFSFPNEETEWNVCSAESTPATIPSIPSECWGKRSWGG